MSCLRTHHDRDAGHYDEFCETRSSAAKTRWKKEKVHMHAKDAKEKEKENEKEKEKEKESVCIGGTPTHNFPTLQEVLFLQQRLWRRSGGAIGEGEAGRGKSFL